MNALAHIYKATQCTDVSDCNYAIEATREAIKMLDKAGKPTAAAYKRLISLQNKLAKLK